MTEQEMMMQGQGQMPPGQPGMSPEDAVNQNLSMLNPTDLAMMQQNGMFDPNMSIREFFAGKGVDVDGPIMQFIEFAQREKENSDPLGKMHNIAAASGGGQPGMGAPPPAAPPPPMQGGGMEDLMGGM